MELVKNSDPSELEMSSLGEFEVVSTRDQALALEVEVEHCSEQSVEDFESEEEESMKTDSCSSFELIGTETEVTNDDCVNVVNDSIGQNEQDQKGFFEFLRQSMDGTGDCKTSRKLAQQEMIEFLNFKVQQLTTQLQGEKAQRECLKQANEDALFEIRSRRDRPSEVNLRAKVRYLEREHKESCAKISKVEVEKEELKIKLEHQRWDLERCAEKIASLEHNLLDMSNERDQAHNRSEARHQLFMETINKMSMDLKSQVNRLLAVKDVAGKYPGKSIVLGCHMGRPECDLKERPEPPAKELKELAQAREKIEQLETLLGRAVQHTQQEKERFGQLQKYAQQAQDLHMQLLTALQKNSGADKS